MIDYSANKIVSTLYCLRIFLTAYKEEPNIFSNLCDFRDKDHIFRSKIPIKNARFGHQIKPIGHFVQSNYAVKIKISCSWQ